LSKDQYDHHVSIARLAQTCKGLNVAVKARLDSDAHKAVSFFMQTTIWASHRFARKPYLDRAQMNRLFWPERWPYVSNAQVANDVARYITPETNMLKLFVVWIHRRQDQLAVQVGIHEHEGPIRVFHITDHDREEDASETASDGDSVLASEDEQDDQDNQDAIVEHNNHIMQDLGNNFVITDTAVLAVLQDEEDNEDEDDEDEEDDNNTLIPVTAIDAVEDEDAEADVVETQQADDRTPEEINLHYSGARPRWVDSERTSEDVTAAELSSRVEAWLRLKHEQFFPFLVIQ